MIASHNIIVLKFGGGVIGSVECLEQMGKIIAERIAQGYKPCIVVSAIGKTTDQLKSMVDVISENPPKKELDVILSAGEIISSALASIYLNSIGIHSRSFVGQQIGIVASENFTYGDIVSVHPEKIFYYLSHNTVPVIAGFQGQTANGEVVTLGRGGSDLTAVALGKALQAEVVELYKDVDGVCKTDPKKDISAKVIPFLDYTQAIKLAKKNERQIVYIRALQYAKNHQVKLHIIPFNNFKDESKGTYILSEVPVPAKKAA